MHTDKKHELIYYSVFSNYYKIGRSLIMICIMISIIAILSVELLWALISFLLGISLIFVLNIGLKKKLFNIIVELRINDQGIYLNEKGLISWNDIVEIEMVKSFNFKKTKGIHITTKQDKKPVLIMLEKVNILLEVAKAIEKHSKFNIHQMIN